MQTWERILFWINFFDKIRPKEQIESELNSENKERLITGLSVFQKLSHIHGINDLDHQLTKVFSQTKFLNFEERDLEKFNLSSNLSRSSEERLIDVASILHEISNKHHVSYALRTKTHPLPNEEINSLITSYATIKSIHSANQENYINLLKEKFSYLEVEAKLNTETETRILLDETVKSIEKHRTEALHDILDQLEEKKNSLLSASKSEMDAYKLEIGASLVVKDADELWSSKYNSHKNSFYITGLLFTVGVAASIILPVLYWAIVKKEILALEPLFQGHILGAITLLLIPVLGIAWVLRLLSRFTIQNMILADDAQMRRVMAQTYVKLVSAKAIEDPQDRAIILTALFRPLPGAQGEDISPPSIADVLKIGPK